MQLVVGLGNPGRRFAGTRHNLGFVVVDVLASRWRIALDARRHQAETGVGEIAGCRVVLAKPQTFMNLSGEAVGRLRRAYRVAVADVIAIYDDLDLPAGRVRIRGDGGAGGHNGVASLITLLGKGFPRVRIGIGRPPGGADPVEYVLERFGEHEQALVAAAVETAADGVESLLRNGLERTMGLFNRRPTGSG